MISVRVADIAKAMGVSPALIVYHFDTKENLLVEALIHAEERDLSTLGRIIRAGKTPVDRLMGALDWYSPTGDARGWQIWIDAWSAAMRDRTLAKVLNDLQSRWVDEIARAISDGVAEGVFSAPDPQASATRITAFLDGIAVRALVNKPRPSADEVRAWLVRQVAMELDVEPNRLTPTKAAVSS